MEDQHPATIKDFILKAAGYVPAPVKTFLLGKRSSPSRFASVIHGILNRAPGERYPVLDCSGALKGYRMRVDWTKHRSFAYGTWEPEVVRAISARISPGMTVLDLGAESGFYTLLLSKLTGPNGSVYAFEPLPANVRILEENLRMNGVANVRVVRQAVGAAPGTLEFGLPDEDSTLLAGPLTAEEANEKLVVPMTSLDAFLSEQRSPVHFIKMDVEGAEGDVIAGAAKTIETQRPEMMIELHNIGTQKTHPLVSELERMGYHVDWLSEIKYNTHILARRTAAPPCD